MSSEGLAAHKINTDKQEAGFQRQLINLLQIYCIYFVITKCKQQKIYVDIQVVSLLQSFVIFEFGKKTSLYSTYWN